MDDFPKDKIPDSAWVADLPSLPSSTCSTIPGFEEPAAAVVDSGYSASRGGYRGRALLENRRSFCAELVMRLKDGPVPKDDEIRFWSGLMARIAPGPHDAVTFPPSSMKKGKRFYLAELLARGVALEMRLPLVRAFTNETPRGHRASMQSKLSESAFYAFHCDPSLSYLVVDDFYCTGSTMMRCAAAAGDARLEFLFLGRS